MLRIHSNVYTNFSVSECALLIIAGAQFNDSVTGKLDSFASSAKIIHFEIDPPKIGKNKRVDLSFLEDIKRIAQEIILLHK